MQTGSGSLALQFPEADLSHPDTGGGALILALPLLVDSSLGSWSGVLDSASKPLTHTCSHAHFHSYTLALTCSHMFSQLHSCPHSHTLILTPSHSLFSHSHGYTLVLTHAHSHTHTLSHTQPLILTHSYTPSHTLTLVLTHSFSCLHSSSHTRSLSLSAPFSLCSGCFLFPSLPGAQGRVNSGP